MSEWNHMVVTDNDVMKLEMRFLLIFIFRKHKKVMQDFKTEKQYIFFYLAFRVKAYP